MKKFYMIILVFLLVVSLAACGRRNNTDTIPTTQPSTGMDLTPDMPPVETNIPDPNVDTSMPMYTDGTDGTDMVNPTTK